MAMKEYFPFPKAPSSLWLVGGILTGIRIPDQSGPGSNGKKVVLPALQSSRVGVFPSESFVPYPWYLLEEVMSLCSDEVGVS